MICLERLFSKVLVDLSLVIEQLLLLLINVICLLFVIIVTIVVVANGDYCCLVLQLMLPNILKFSVAGCLFYFLLFDHCTFGSGLCSAPASCLVL